MTTDLITYIDYLPYEIDQELRRRVCKAGLEDAFDLISKRVDSNKSTDVAVADAVARITSFLELQSDLPSIDSYRNLWRQIVLDEVRLSRTTLMQIRKSNEFKHMVMIGNSEKAYKQWVGSLDYTSGYLVQKMTHEGRSMAYLLFSQGVLTRSKLRTLSVKNDYAASMGYKRRAIDKSINKQQTAELPQHSLAPCINGDIPFGIQLEGKAAICSEPNHSNPYELFVMLQGVIDALLDSQSQWEGDQRVLEAVDPQRLSLLTSKLYAAGDLFSDF